MHFYWRNKIASVDYKYLYSNTGESCSYIQGLAPCPKASKEGVHRHRYYPQNEQADEEL